MKQNKIFLWIIFFLFLTTYNFDFTNNSFAPIFKIENIEIEGLELSNENEIKKKFNKLKNKSIIFIDNENLKNIINNTEFIDSFTLKKIYPNTIKIKITEKEPIAILQHMKERKFFTSKGNLIDFLDLKTFKDLPTVFGDRKNFLIFYNDLKTIKFPLNEIKTFYFFESKRWDLLTLKDQLIKLPTNNYDESLTNFMKLKDQPNFTKYKIFDYRIKDQLILK